MSPKNIQKQQENTELSFEARFKTKRGSWYQTLTRAVKGILYWFCMGGGEGWSLDHLMHNLAFMLQTPLLGPLSRRVIYIYIFYFLIQSQATVGHHPHHHRPQLGAGPHLQAKHTLWSKRATQLIIRERYGWRQCFTSYGWRGFLLFLWEWLQIIASPVHSGTCKIPAVWEEMNGILLDISGIVAPV